MSKLRFKPGDLALIVGTPEPGYLCEILSVYCGPCSAPLPGYTRADYIIKVPGRPCPCGDWCIDDKELMPPNPDEDQFGEEWKENYLEKVT